MSSGCNVNQMVVDNVPTQGLQGLLSGVGKGMIKADLEDVDG